MELDVATAVVLGLANGPVRPTNPTALDALYRSLPKVVCLGECWSSCGGDIQVSPLEKQRIERTGFRWVQGAMVPLPDGTLGATVCSALDQQKLVCRIYADRPMICRLWGIFESLACPWGCRPKGGMLDDVEAMRLLNLAMWHGGSVLAIDPELWEKAASRPDYRRALREHLEKGRPARDPGAIVQGTIRLRPGL